MNFLKLIRYKDLLMVLLTMVLTKYALIHSFITNSYLSDLEFSILALSVLFITSGGYIINEIYDLEADKLNKPYNVFINKTISIKNAWRSYFLLTILGLILGIFVSFDSSHKTLSFIFIFTTLSLFLHSIYLKKLPLVGNFIISLFIWLIIILVASFEYKETYNGHDYISALNLNKINSFNFYNVVWVYAFFSFLTTLIREIIKDIEDVNGDLKIKAKTLPILFGRKRASKVAFFFSSVLLVFLLLILQFIKSEILLLGYGIIFILLPLLYFLYKLWFSKSKQDYSKLSIHLKIIMLFGILSMLLFTI
jgi:4-hydroxybenzoate polyprenyltransferase